MPTLRVPVRGSFVMTAGSVMNGAASPGQHFWIGSRSRLASSPSRTISWDAARLTVFGRESAIDLSFCSPRTLSTRPAGGCISSTSLSFAATSSSEGDIEREAHPPLGAELVDQQRQLRAIYVLEQQRRAARLHRAVDDLRDLELRVDLGARRGRARPRARARRPSREDLPAAPSRVSLRRVLERGAGARPAPRSQLLPRVVDELGE